MCSVEGQWFVEPKDFVGGGRARRSLRGMLFGLQMPLREVVDVELIAGELLTNALRYTDDAVRLTVTHRNSLLHVCVHDRGAGFDVSTPFSDNSADGGRGIAIVRSLSNIFDVLRADNGCTVSAIIQSDCIASAA